MLLVSRRPERFRFAVFLSAWVNPKPKTVAAYCRFAGMAAGILHWRWLVRLQGRYWGYTPEQAARMADYAVHITPQGFRSFFANTLNLRDLPGYAGAALPMLAVCGSGEVGDMKRSLALLGENPHCRTRILPHAGHDFPMRRPAELNALLDAFLAELP